MRLGFDGAIATASRPYGLFGKPLFASVVISVQVAPPSAERYKPLPDGLSGPSPPERNVQPFRRKSHMQAKSTLGSFGSLVTHDAPVEGFAPFKIRFQVLPPSVVLYSPRSVESHKRFPGNPA